MHVSFHNIQTLGQFFEPLYMFPIALFLPFASACIHFMYLIIMHFISLLWKKLKPSFVNFLRMPWGSTKGKIGMGSILGALCIAVRYQFEALSVLPCVCMLLSMPMVLVTHLVRYDQIVHKFLVHPLSHFQMWWSQIRPKKYLVEDSVLETLFLFCRL